MRGLTTICTLVGISALLAAGCGGGSGSSGSSPTSAADPNARQLVTLSGRPVKFHVVYDSADASNHTVTGADGRFEFPRPLAGNVLATVGDADPLITRAPGLL